ncbi:hypothetical protein QE152_g7303 [Popillia japonica]|uniref:Uncharacterized protein n=1 Tax=Popillia japonica TaxID=7064 RepID=A0AAW1MFK6_POPJA
MSFHAVIKAEREQKTIKKGLSIYVRFVGLRNADATARKSQHVEGQNEVNALLVFLDASADYIQENAMMQEMPNVPYDEEKDEQNRGAQIRRNAVAINML